MCLTGSCPQLGMWKPDQVVPMKRQGCPDENIDSDTPDVWSVEVAIPLGSDVYFRYCVCICVEYGHERRFVIKTWETRLKARKIGCHDMADPDSIHEFGFINTQESLTQCGWLTKETLVELKLFEKPVQIWKKKHQNKNLFVKITPVDVKEAGQQSFCSEMDESIDIAETRFKGKSWPVINAASLDGDDCRFHPQSQFGIEVKEDGFVSFQAQMFDLHTVAFLVDIFARSDPEKELRDTLPAEHLGSCYVLPNHFKSTEGRVEQPIVSKGFQPIGQFSATYLIIKPLKDAPCDFSISYAQHWKSNWKRLDVGHRGLGNSYSETQYCSNICENTIASLKDSVAHGADMVEFDVQLSKDLVPVIYHNFELCTVISTKKGGQEVSVTMPVKNLTLEQLQQLKTHHVEELTSGRKNFSEDHEDHEPFPSLERALREIDPHAGFNVEIKWDMEFPDGSRECHNPFEMNLFIDVVLQKVLECGGERKIVFSSFNPDVCTTIRCKQNKYPVLFLTQGVNSKYANYRDPRTRNIPNASKFVEMAEILGINAMAEDLLRDPGQVDIVKKRGQVLFCWTDDKNDKDTLNCLKGMDLDGIVYDRMDMNNSKLVKESIFLMDKRFESNEDDDFPVHIHQKTSPTHSSCSCASGTKETALPSPSSIIVTEFIPASSAEEMTPKSDVEEEDGENCKSTFITKASALCI